MENNNIDFVKFPFKIHYKEKPSPEILSENKVKVTLLNYPRDDFRKTCAMKIMSTWGDRPVRELSDEESIKIFKDMIEGKTLPNPMESLVFDFLVENISNIESIYILRHRSASSILAKTSGERDIRHDNFIIPESIKNSDFSERYTKLCLDCYQLYSDMVDSDNISLMDARMIMPKCMSDYIYFSFNLKEVINFINQRKCAQVHSYMINEVCRQMYNLVTNIIPELKNVLSLNCDKRCHWINSPLDKNTRLFLPNKNHRDLFDYNPDNYYYKKRRIDMGVFPTVQDN